MTRILFMLFVLIPFLTQVLDKECSSFERDFSFRFENFFEADSRRPTGEKKFLKAEGKDPRGSPLLIQNSRFLVSGEEPAAWKGTSGKFIAEIELSSLHVNLDETLVVHLVLTHPSNYQPDVNALRRNLLSYEGLGEASFKLVKERISSSVPLPGGLKKQEIDFILSPNLPGRHYLTFQKVYFDQTNGGKKEKATIVSGVFQISIIVPELDFFSENAMAPLMPLSEELPISISRDSVKKYLRNTQIYSEEAKRNTADVQSKSIPWTGLLAFFAVSLVFLLIKLSPPPALRPEIAQLIDPKEEAINEIESISQRGLLEKGLYHFYFSLLDHVIRKYIASKYRIDAMTSTTQEFFENARSMQMLDAETRDKLFQFMQRADNVKYADYHPTIEDIKEAEQAARNFIHTI